MKFDQPGPTQPQGIILPKGALPPTPGINVINAGDKLGSLKTFAGGALAIAMLGACSPGAVRAQTPTTEPTTTTEPVKVFEPVGQANLVTETQIIRQQLKDAGQAQDQIEKFTATSGMSFPKSPTDKNPEFSLYSVSTPTTAAMMIDDGTGSPQVADFVPAIEDGSITLNLQTYRLDENRKRKYFGPTYIKIALVKNLQTDINTVFDFGDTQLYTVAVDHIDIQPWQRIVNATNGTQDPVFNKFASGFSDVLKGMGTFIGILPETAEASAPATPTKVLVPPSTRTITPVPTNPIQTKVPEATATTQPLETQQAAIDSATSLSAALTNAGIKTSAADILKQGLQQKTFTGKDGQTYGVAYTKDGYPLMIKSNGNWAPITANLNVLNNLSRVKLGSQAVYYKLSDGTYKQILTGDFNTFLISGELNEPTLWLQPDQSQVDPYKKYATYDFKRADQIIDLASANGADLHAGHILDPRRQDFLPSWLAHGTFTKQEYIDILKAHVNDVMTHIGNRADVSKTMVSVVNETFDWNKYDGFWVKAIGSEYVQIAYQQARDSNKNIKLIYNDVNAFYNGQVDDHDKAVFTLVSDLKQKGLIDGVGFEMHLDASSIPSIDAVKQLIDMYSKIGVKVYITEFDVDTSKLSGSPAEIQQKKADVYVEMLKVFLNEPNIDSTTFFGFSTAVSWKPNTDSLIFDNKYQAEKVFYEVAKLLLSKSQSQNGQ